MSVKNYGYKFSNIFVFKYYFTLMSRAQSPKNDVEFPEKVAEGLSPWHSSSGYNTMFQSSANKVCIVNLWICQKFF